MTKWLTDLLAEVPANFQPSANMGKQLPEGSTVLGPLPEDIKPLLVALMWLRASHSEHQTESDDRALDKSFWQFHQEDALNNLITASVHHHFGVFDGPVGAGMDRDGTLISFSLPMPDSTPDPLVVVIVER